MSTTEHFVETCHCNPRREAGLPVTARRTVDGIVAWFRDRIEHVRAQSDLCRLNDHLRRDIGLEPRRPKDALSGPEMYIWERSRIK